MHTGLALVTVNAPHRRVDIALPQDVPLADLLSEIVRHAGAALADDGEAHGGWVLRRTDGTALESGASLAAQGVRDGELLHLVPAHQEWPELEFDDVVEAIADGARSHGTAWSGQHTVVAALAAAGVALGAALVVLLRAGPDSIAAMLTTLGVAASLTVAGILAARAYGHRPAGIALGAYSLPYAFAAGALLLAGGDAVGPVPGLTWIGAPELLLGSAALALHGVLGIIGVGAGRRIFSAAVLTGLLGAATAGIGFALTARGAAAILLAVLVCGVGLLPLLAIRTARLPIPPVTATDTDQEGERVRTAVTRAEEILGGLLIGHAVLASVAAVLLAATGGGWGRTLTAVCGVALLLRARVFRTVRQRVPLLAAGTVALAAAALAVAGRPDQLTTVLAGALGLAVAVLLTAAGVGYARRPAGPYLGRTADLLDTGLLVAVIPVACAVLGLFAQAQTLVD
ncbi:type VII secretion integral membrane protein EccD [Asanoa ishikariensis]|uniref:Type VII secretion integral membrane protein EccD n=1 Tax=Asanoa ishikariensis TaxID=137265 RepID=A0A1H3UWP7_9ACTN|nr:type VII secretion integral membrane protein EccD [Asanoa ishikariensis]GIF65146.1 type VII secretion integral membrane protein EccD [Asanoa ishikariensis]SDZ66411.1 type VII secretion integral membrane protein EccD [Asanoa ishikariensis]